MKPSFAAAFLGAAVLAFAAPPGQVAGMKFTDIVPAGTGLFAARGTELLLNADGTYTGLRLFEWRDGMSGVGAGGPVIIPELVEVSIPRNGVWTYRVIDQSTAEIVLDGRPLRLQFTASNMSGVVDDPIPFRLNRTFRFDTYEATTRLANCSTHAYLAPGRSVSLGFVITEGERRVLVRAIGPGLRTFGITQPLPDPVLRVHGPGSTLPVDLGEPATSRATLDVAAQRAGAFPLPTANDHGKYLALRQGAYIATVTAADPAADGEVLVEVYQLP